MRTTNSMKKRKLFAPVHCPRCDRLMPFWRWPKSLRQLLWGGWTCQECGCEMNRKGQAIKQ